MSLHFLTKPANIYLFKDNICEKQEQCGASVLFLSLESFEININKKDTVVFVVDFE